MSATEPELGDPIQYDPALSWADNVAGVMERTGLPEHVAATLVGIESGAAPGGDLEAVDG